MTKKGPDPLPHRKIYESRDGKVQISTNIPGFHWPTREEKIAGLLECGLIDEADADRLSSQDPA